MPRIAKLYDLLTWLMIAALTWVAIDQLEELEASDERK